MFGPAFIERWMGAGFAQSGEILLVLVVPYCLFLIQYPGLGLMFSIDAHRTLAKVAWGGSVLNLVLSIVLGIQFGLMGVVWATVVDLALVYGVLFPVALTRAVGIPLGQYLGTVVWGAAQVVLPAAVYYLLVRGHIEPDYLNLALLSGGLGLIYLAVLRFTGALSRGG